MKAIFYNSKRIGEDNIIWGLLELNIEVDRSELILDLDLIYDDQVERLEKEIREYDFVITRNFSVNAAEACHMEGIPYISWCYDSPLLALYSKEALYPTNYVFVFDKKHLLRLKDMRLEHVYYQPLAANIIKAGRVSITDDDLRKYACDVSFVGGMYYKRYYEIFKKEIDDNDISECEKMFEKHLCLWDKDSRIIDELPARVIDSFYSKMSKEDRNLYTISDRYLVERLIMVIELTSRERVKLLNESARIFDTVVHTHEPENFRQMLEARLEPPVKELSDELYRIYAAARINLNITMRSIETGIPQRVFDIMSVGGCVFSNYQEEAEELFEPDKEIVLFKSLEEFKEKAKYYLSHEKELLNIGARGYLKVRDKYNYAESLRNMISKL